MEEEKYVVVGCLIGITIGLFIGATLMKNFPEGTFAYKQGQIDAANGKMLIELVKQPDGSTKWVRKK